jgi:hypothetical protein
MAERHKLLRTMRKFVPESLRALVRRSVSVTDYDIFIAEQSDPYANDPPVFTASESPCTLGIIREPYHNHQGYIGACRELGVSYKLLDIAGSDWIRVVEESGCDAFVVWPTGSSIVWKEMFDDRLRILEQELGRIVYPTRRETWLYENKRRENDWLTANGIPHPRTWVFYDRREAEEFVRQADMPLVFKTSLGACHSGVRILRGRREAMRTIGKAFARGIVPERYNSLERQRGSVYFQEYLPHVQEWRMIRLGHSYFGHRKEQVGDYHSGSGAWTWLEPPRPLFELLRRVTEKGQFTSMDMDTFETQDGRLLVNELQSLFGARLEQMKIGGKPARYLYDAAADQWILEEGEFCRNSCCNLRIEYLIHAILKKA